MEWKNAKAHLRMVRCFSFIGPYTEKDRDDMADMAAEQKKKRDIEAEQKRKQNWGKWNLFSHHHNSDMAAEQKKKHDIEAEQKRKQDSDHAAAEQKKKQNGYYDNSDSHDESSSGDYRSSDSDDESYILYS